MILFFESRSGKIFAVDTTSRLLKKDIEKLTWLFGEAPILQIEAFGEDRHGWDLLEVIQQFLVVTPHVSEGPGGHAAGQLNLQGVLVAFDLYALDGYPVHGENFSSARA